jgi:hypothetical protein
MPYTIRPKSGGFGLLAAFAYDPHQALDIARYMLQRGVKEVEIIADEEVPPELAEHGGVVVTRANE